jgi:exportin-2 (importin alpha re-exporter)
MFYRQKMFTALELWLSKGEHVSKEVVDDDPDASLTAIDYEEQTAGYQAAFSKLAASQPRQIDPVAHVSDPIIFVKQALPAAAQNPNVKQLLESIPQSQWARMLLSGQFFTS